MNVYDYGFEAGYAGEECEVDNYVNNASFRDQEQFMIGWSDGKAAADKDFSVYTDITDAYLRSVATYN